MILSHTHPPPTPPKFKVFLTAQKWFQLACHSTWSMGILNAWSIHFLVHQICQTSSSWIWCHSAFFVLQLRFIFLRAFISVLHTVNTISKKEQGQSFKNILMFSDVVHHIKTLQSKQRAFGNIQHYNEDHNKSAIQCNAYDMIHFSAFTYFNPCDSSSEEHIERKCFKIVVKY